MHKKKILMIAATPFFSDRGCHIRIYNEIKNLQRHMYSVDLVTYGLGTDLEGLTVHRSIRAPWYKKIGPGASWHKIYLDFFLLCKSIQIFFKQKPDVIHAHQYESLIIGYVLKKLSLNRVPLLFDYQGSLAEEVRNKKFYKTLSLLEGILLKMPDHIVASSEKGKDFLEKKFTITRPISVVSDGCDIDLFENKKTPVHNKTLIYAGSMSEEKGVRELLGFVPSVLERVPAARFIFLGYGPLKDTYELLYKDYVDAGKVVFLGQTSYFMLPVYLMGASYGIDPKKNTSESSAKILNYLAAGLVTVCFDCPFPELKDHVEIISSFDELIPLVQRGDAKSMDTEQVKKISWDNHINSLIHAYKTLI